MGWLTRLFTGDPNPNMGFLGVLTGSVWAIIGILTIIDLRQNAGAIWLVGGGMAIGLGVANMLPRRYHKMAVVLRIISLIGAGVGFWIIRAILRPFL